MPAHPSPLARVVTLGCLALIAACGDAADPVVAPAPSPQPPQPPAAVRIVVTTMGADQDDDGYLADVFGGSPLRTNRIGPNGSVTVDSLRQAIYSVWLHDVADNCGVVGPNPLSFPLASGAVADAEFTVACAAKGTVEVSAEMSGGPPDPDGFVVKLDRGTLVERILLPGGGTGIARFTAGPLILSVLGVAANCSFAPSWGGSTDSIGVESGVTLRLSVRVACGPVVGPELAVVRDGRIHGVNADGTALVRLTDGPGDADPAWARDGRLAFVRDGNIHVRHHDGAIVQLTSGSGNRHPAWSPDGRQVAYATDCLVGSCLRIIDVDVRGATPLAIEPEGWSLTWPAWSPDGQWLVVASEEFEFGFRFVLLLNRELGISRTLQTAVTQPAWSPDGKRLVAVNCRREVPNCWSSSDIVAVKPDGSAPATLAASVGLSRPGWSPNSTEIVFATPPCTGCRDAVWIMLADGGGSRRLLLENAHSPAWRW
jgi:hypothetical protein